jgi:hypothetical protein
MGEGRRKKRGTMKRIYSIILCLVMFTLAASPAVVRAHEVDPQAATAAETTFAHLYLMRAVAAPTPWWQTSTLVDPAGGVHTAFFTSQHIHYAYCPANCSDSVNWSQTPLIAAGSYDSLDFPALALDSSGRPRMMWYIDPDYYYAECDTGCTDTDHWTAVKVPVATQSNYYPQTARYFALDKQNRPSFVTYGAASDGDHSYEGFQYTTCAGGCTSAANWHSAVIDLDQWVSDPQIVLTADGQPRVMGKSDHETLIYLGCETNCLQSGSWGGVFLYDVGYYGNFSFRLDAQDRPRVAFYTQDSGDANLYYAWSNSTDYTSIGWDNYGRELAPFDWRTVDLAIDSHGRPRLVFASSSGDLEYTLCTASCESASAAWQLQHVETAAELDAADPIYDVSCSASAWLVNGYPSLALDGADRPSISYYARHSKFCLGKDGQYHTLHDVDALRFATAGTGQTPGDLKVYLPLAVRP